MGNRPVVFGEPMGSKQSGDSEHATVGPTVVLLVRRPDGPFPSMGTSTFAVTPPFQLVVLVFVSVLKQDEGRHSG